ncbi:hypothetical protein ACLIYM_02840 [Streptomyces fenghuangensis]
MGCRTKTATDPSAVAAVTGVPAVAAAARSDVDAAAVVCPDVDAVAVAGMTPLVMSPVTAAAVSHR